MLFLVVGPWWNVGWLHIPRDLPSEGEWFVAQALLLSGRAGLFTYIHTKGEKASLLMSG